jgi:hypothetical protein
MQKSHHKPMVALPAVAVADFALQFIAIRQ